ncbi:MAG: adenylate/guanylate cyclase domain-containing protein [SAR324 cluster bacterium]|nr:adenylate/guanylate cyclase domain-containing protein [SAR324 cluster bacterium]
MTSSIVIVDDSRSIRGHVRRVLESAPEAFQVIEHEDGLDALRWLSTLSPSNLPDLILLDRNMPQITGDECIRILKADSLWNTIPVLFLTAQVSVQNLVQGLVHLAADDYLPKPFAADELIARVQVLLRMKKAEDQSRELNRQLQHALDEQVIAYQELKTTKLKLAETEAANRLTRLFEKFVPKGFLERIAPEGLESLRFGTAESDEATILFSDIRSFTDLSEPLSPQELMDFLNDYLKMMNMSIMVNHGFVDKFIGDAVMAIFDRTEQSSNDARNALNAGMGMLQVLGTMNQKRKRQGQIPISIGIGIHTGPVVFGTLGFEERMDSTVLGDAVNLASRLESLTKYYGASLLFSDQTYEALGDEKENLLIRKIDTVMVKGRKRPVTIYELFNSDSPDVQSAKKMVMQSLEEPLSLYRQRKWIEAEQLFTDLARNQPLDSLPTIYVERCQNLLENSPSDDWAGVHVFNEK